MGRKSHHPPIHPAGGWRNHHYAGSLQQCNGADLFSPSKTFPRLHYPDNLKKNGTETSELSQKMYRKKALQASSTPTGIGHIVAFPGRQRKTLINPVFPGLSEPLLAGRHQVPIDVARLRESFTTEDINR